MEKLLLKHFLITLHGLALFESLLIDQNKILAKEINENDLIEININSDESKLIQIENNHLISKEEIFFKNEVLNDLQANGSNLFNLVAFEQKDLDENYFVEIDADTQYRDGELFIAEGNAIIYLSDATLKGDLIKYDLQKKLLTVIGNVIFNKGRQYFEASKLSYNLKEDKGYIDDVYGLLDSKTFTEDFKLDLNKNDKLLSKQKIKGEVDQPEFVNTATIGLVNDFEKNKTFNITKADLRIPTISKWRYKTNKLIYNSKTLDAKRIFFTNDIYNKPQFVFLSKNFSAKIEENKLRLLSRNSWIILDNKLKIPIGRRSIFDKDPLTKWGIGADYQDKDGYFLFRGTYPRNIFRDFSLQAQPYFLIQRALEGNTNAFTDKNSSPLSSKVKSDISFSDYFALDLILKGKEKDWNIESKIQLNSLDTSRLDQSLRTKLTLSKRINLNNKQEIESNINSDHVLNKFIGIEESNNLKPTFEEDNSLNNYLKNNKQNTTNFLDFQIYNIFREKVIKDFATEEIYFASGFNIANKRAKSNDRQNTSLSLIYDVGHFKSKSSLAEEFRELFRNSFIGQYNYQFPIWKKSNLDKTIDKTYKFNPKVIPQSLDWATNLQAGLFLYSDGSNQSVIKFKTGPILTIGSFKKKLFDYTQVRTDFNYVLKNGESPFSFDNINDDPRINFNLQQQIFGPLLFSFETSLNLNNGSYTNVNYGLDFNRRAYSIGAFYNSSNESLGIRFNIFNFDYSGLSEKF